MELNEIENLRILVDTAAKKIAAQVEKGSLDELKSLLWNVPTNILVDFTRD